MADGVRRCQPTGEQNDQAMLELVVVTQALSAESGRLLHLVAHASAYRCT
jgi:hypothetical protein